MLLLHGYPQFWWSWRHQLPALAAAGYRAAAMDMRGYGASDKPPRGYDTPTLAADVAGVVRSLGASRAVVVGQDWGAWVAWSMPALQPRVTRAVAAFGMGHPLRMLAGALLPTGFSGVSHLLGAQVPLRPERRILDGSAVERVLTRWSGPGWPGADELARYTEAARVPFVAHTATEYYRWAVRSVPRGDGRRFAAAVRHRVAVPVLQVHGGLDPYVPATRARGSSRWVRDAYRWELVPDAGHFVPEESPDHATGTLLEWLGQLDD